jgi:hypothetical protein
MPIPESAEIIAETESMLMIVRDAVRYGIKKARAYFDGEEVEAADPWLAPNLVRWNAKRMLDGGGHATENLEADYTRNPASNNGLRLSFKRFLIVVRKSDDGALPVPASDTQRTIYSSNLELFESTAPPDDDDTITLVVLWDADPNYTALTSLTLVLPRVGGDSRETTESYWEVPILHVGEQVPDLSIELLDNKEHGTGGAE